MGRTRSRSRDRKRARSRSRDRGDGVDKGDKRDDRSKRGGSRSPGREAKRRRDRSRSRDRGDRRHRDGSRERRRDRSGRGDGDERRHRDGDRAVREDRGDRKDRDRHKDRSHREEEEEEGKAAADAAAADGAANGAKKEPLSLEEILRKKKEEQEQQAKPVFLTKKQREELALQRRAEEAAALQERSALMRTAAKQFQRDQAGGGSGGGGGAEAARRREEDRRQQRDRDAQKKARDEERERSKELELIKQQYLGAKEKRKKVLKPSDKFKFNFDWGAEEDTSRDLNPLYQNPHEAMLLFGRGLRAGMDRREQKKLLADHERQLLKKLRDAAGISETAEDRALDREREDRADKYQGYDMKVEKHWSDKPLEAMTERDWRIFREDFNIAYRGGNPPLPIRSWKEARLPELLQKAVDRHGYKKPSPIQMAAIPLGLQKRDVIGVAETGSGKTAAFVLPMLKYIMEQPVMAGNPDIEAEGPYAVVLAPTRELAQQIEDETKQLAHYSDFRVVSVVGGQSIEDQGFHLRKGCEVVVATPGRLVDCLERSYAVLNQCNYVVLDEADRMIDLGFEPQVMAVLDAMPSSNLKPEDEQLLEVDRVYRTTYMFSATMPPAVERLARKYLRRPVIVTIGSAGKATDTVTQRVLMIKENEKPRMLEQELERIEEDKRIITFVNTKKHCDYVSRQLEDLGYKCTVLHGGRTQDQRELSLAGFREDKFNVLVATDVAGRGIDVQDVALVVNYDMPNNIEQYTHRIGRTGRAGRKGAAVTFVTPSDSEMYYDLKKFLEESKAPVPPELARHEASKVKPGQPGAQRRDKVVFAKK